MAGQQCPVLTLLTTLIDRQRAKVRESSRRSMGLGTVLRQHLGMPPGGTHVSGPTYTWGHATTIYLSERHQQAW